MRNPNGFGTTYKLKGNRRNPWRAAVPVARNEKGQVEYQTVGYYKSEPEAITALSNYHSGLIPAREGITLEQIYSEWSEPKYMYVSKPTIDTYKAAWKHLSPIASLQYSTIRTAHYQKIVDTLKLSRSSLHKIKTLAVQLNDYAMQNDMINKNYATFIKLPKWVKNEKDIFTDAEIIKLKKLQDDQWVKTVLVLIYTGMRIGEMVNLTIFQIDTDRGIITTGSKTEAGQRVIPIHKIIKPFIADLPAILDNVTADKYRKKYYYPALESAEVRKLSPHACRHSFASILARQGVDTLSIQRLMGHADYALTANIYSHPEIEQLKKAIDKL